MPDGAVRVEGLRDLVRAFQIANREVAKDIRTAIEVSGEPIRQEASSLAHSQISGMARSRLPWWTMRTGVLRNTIGYIAPEQRGNKRRTRPTPRRQVESFKRGMMDRAMQPALDHNKDRVYDEFRSALNEVARAWSRI